MSRTIVTLPVSPDPTSFGKTTHYDPLKNDIDLLALGCFGRNQYGGGSEIVGFGVGVGTGQLQAYDSVEFEIDNTSNQISGSANVVIQVRVMVRVENAGISVTPRVFNITDSSVPTQSGAAACTATASDFSGTNQKQTISFTPASGKKRYIVQVAKSADTFQVWCARIAWDCFVNN